MGNKLDTGNKLSLIKRENSRSLRSYISATQVFEIECFYSNGFRWNFKKVTFVNTTCEKLVENCVGIYRLEAENYEWIHKSSMFSLPSFQPYTLRTRTGFNNYGFVLK